MIGVCTTELKRFNKVQSRLSSLPGLPLYLTLTCQCQSTAFYIHHLRLKKRLEKHPENLIKVMEILYLVYSKLYFLENLLEKLRKFAGKFLEFGNIFPVSFLLNPLSARIFTTFGHSCSRRELCCFSRER